MGTWKVSQTGNSTGRVEDVKMANRIYVLEGGRVVESGTHDELVCRNGRYARLFEIKTQYCR